MSGFTGYALRRFFELYKADVIGTIRLNIWMIKEHMIRTKILPFFSGMKMSELEHLKVNMNDYLGRTKVEKKKRINY